MLLAESFICPFIKTSDFPINFKVRDIYTIKYAIRHFLSISVTFNPGFIQKINKSKYVKNFILSKEYKRAEALFELSESKKELEKLFNTNDSRFIETCIRNLLANIDFSQFFPFSPEIIKPNLIIGHWVEKYGPFFRLGITHSQNNASEKYRYTIPILGDFENSSFYITKQNLNLLVMSNITKIDLPYVPKDHISKILSSYTDLNYKYFTIVEIDNQFFATVTLEALIKRLAKHFSTYHQVFEHEFFIRPRPNKLNTRSSPMTYYVVDAYGHKMVINLEFGLDNYIMIYSNEYPLEHEIIKNFKDACDYFADSLVVFEIQKN